MKMVKSLLLGLSSTETTIGRSGPKFGPGRYIPIGIKETGGIEGSGLIISTETGGIDGGTVF